MISIEVRITKAGVKRYRARVRLKGFDLSSTFNSREEAQDYINLQTARILNGYTLSPASTLSQVLKAFMDHRSSGLADSTRRGYKTTVKILEGYLKNIPVIDILSIHVSQLLENLQKKYKPSTTRLYYRTFVMLMRYALRQGLITIDPTLHVHVPRPDTALPHALNQEQVAALLSKAEGDTVLKSLILIAISSGMRIGELLSLQVNNIDLSERTITLQSQQTKTRTARKVVVAACAWPSIEDLVRAQQGAPEGGEAKLFQPSRKGARRLSIQRAWNVLRERAALTAVRFHDLRHTCATWLIKGGCPLSTVAQILGHRNISTTMIYTRMDTSEMTRRIDATIRGVLPGLYTSEDPNRTKWPKDSLPSCPDCLTKELDKARLQGALEQAKTQLERLHGLFESAMKSAGQGQSTSALLSAFPSSEPPAQAPGVLEVTQIRGMARGEAAPHQAHRGSPPPP